VFVKTGMQAMSISANGHLFRNNRKGKYEFGDWRNGHCSYDQLAANVLLITKEVFST
jgi:hypothetical protein